jgi:hypothetical protein
MIAIRSTHSTLIIIMGTEEENNGYVVFKLNIHVSAGKQGGDFRKGRYLRVMN